MVVNLDIHKSLIERSKRGNRGAQYELYRLYAKAMYNICFRMMNSKEDAEDMLQESFSEVFTKMSSFKYESTFGAWIKKVVVNRCINELKRRKTSLQYFENMEYFDTLDDEKKENDKEIKMSVERIKKAMTFLPEGGRIIFSLYMLEGYDHGEIGEIMSITESTSRSQFTRAKKRIIEILEEQELNETINI